MLVRQWSSLCILQGLARAWAAWRAATEYWAAKRAAITAASGFHTRRLLTAWFKLCHRSAQLHQLMQQAGAKLMQAGLARVSLEWHHPLHSLLHIAISCLRCSCRITNRDDSDGRAEAAV